MRSNWKPVFITSSLLKKINYLDSLEDKTSSLISIYNRSSTILPELIGVTVNIHNVKLFIH